jgi:hypothetical protein
MSLLEGVGGTEWVLSGTRFDLTFGSVLRGGDERLTADAGRGGGAGRFPGDGGGIASLVGDVVCALGGGGAGEGFAVSAPAWE